MKQNLLKISAVLLWFTFSNQLVTLAASSVALITVRFQKDVSPATNFFGCKDSTFRSLYGNTFGWHSLGKDQALDPRWKDVEGAGIIWFDLSSIPAQAQILSATLKLWHEPSEFETTAGRMLLYPLHDPNGTGMWEENTGAVYADYENVVTAGCALFKRSGVPWSSLADGRYNTVLNTGEVVTCAHGPGVTNWLTFDVARDVKVYLTNAAQNLGWIFYTETDDTIRGQLYTSDSVSPAKRPILEVTYEIGPTTNQPPQVNADADQTITLGDALILNGTVTDDGLPTNQLSVVWTNVSGPGTVTFTNTSVLTTRATFSTNGVYVLRLTASDSELTASDDIQVTVNSVSNQPTNGIAPFILLSDFIRSTYSLHFGEIPEDTFAASTNVIYVAPISGSDTNPGTLIAPVRTLDRAIAIVNAIPGTPYTICLRGGIHYFKGVDSAVEIRRGNIYVTAFSNELVTIRPFYWPGNPSAWWEQRCFVSYGAYTNLTFEKLTIEGWQIAFDIGASGSTTMRQVTFKNIIAKNFRHRDGDPNQFRVFLQTKYLPDDVYGAGKQIFTNPAIAHFQLENVIVSNIEVYDTDITINIGDENDANVKGLRISNFRLINPVQSPSGTSANDGFAIVNCYKVLIDGCVIKNVNDDGIDTKVFDVAVINTYVEGTGRNAVKFWRNGELINCIIVACTPIDDGAIIVGSGPCRIVHSALITKTNGYAATFGYGYDPTTVGILEIVNSIFLHLDHSLYVATSNMTSKNSLYFDIRDNLFTGGGGSVANVGMLNARTGSAGNLALDPRLSVTNFVPQGGSPCIDNGTSVGVLLPSFDFFGNPRVSGLNPDIGPIERSVEPPVLTVIPTTITGQFAFQWRGAPGLVYDVYSATDLGGPWSPVSAMSGRVGNGGILFVTNTAAYNPAMFYRVTAH